MAGFWLARSRSSGPIFLPPSSASPALDMIRFTKLGAGASWVGEYGDPENAEERAAILKYSPYQNVKAA